ncbi:MAG: hypothetical protein IID51_11170 [Proteobacteria bacterium]|nr:hypothetical protein [Pseudomonadota bacterium]
MTDETIKVTTVHPIWKDHSDETAPPILVLKFDTSAGQLRLQLSNAQAHDLAALLEYNLPHR